MASSSYSSLYIPLVAVVGRLPVVEGDAFPRDNDNLTLAVALSLLPCIRLYKEIANCIDRGGNGSSSRDVAVI